ncbi:MAG TPA: CheB methylesterase domain-containing protein, partial [Spirochaetota bacterium]|nr:CheB methylesterase domain-containing protein [Spirochaetota bacterium]
VLKGSTDKVIALGASTGGTVALRKILSSLPANIPGVVITQHMPAGFTSMFAQRLNSETGFEVKEAEDGDRIVTGRILIAPGDYHMRVERSGGYYITRISSGEELVNGHRPSVEVLFNSVAEHAGSNALGGILTGMGRDGAYALGNMRQRGARTFAQDEKTAVVFGMPKEAYKCGAAERLVALESIPCHIVNLLEEMK